MGLHSKSFSFILYLAGSMHGEVYIMILLWISLLFFFFFLTDC